METSHRLINYPDRTINQHLLQTNSKTSMEFSSPAEAESLKMLETDQSSTIETKATGEITSRPTTTMKRKAKATEKMRSIIVTSTADPTM